MKKNYFLTASIAILAAISGFAQPTVPANPPAGNVNNCTVLTSTGAPIDQCPVGSTTFISNFQGGTYNRGNNGNNLGTGAIWRFTNIGTVSGVIINAEVTINSLSNAVITNMDDNSATDQAGASVADFFGPVISPDVSLNAADRRGYAQFTLNFFQGSNNFTTPITLSGLNLVSYDADGSYNTAGTSSQSWFRETRVSQSYAAGNPTILAGSGTELVAYNYTDPVATTWTGFAGSVYERTGISRCAQVASSFRYGNGANGRNAITFRFGYDFKAGNGYNVGNPGRQYGVRFGCYSFPNQITLPVTLLSFNGAFKNNATQLNWVAENQVNFSHYEIERSSDGISFNGIGTKTSVQNNTTARENYQHSDNLAVLNGNVFFYRLKMIDIDGSFKYSNVILIRKDQKNITGLTLNPNPIVSGSIVTVRFEAATKNTVEFKVLDLSGRVILKQQNYITEGTNSIAITNLDRLESGMYVLQMNDGNNISVTKFIISH